MGDSVEHPFSKFLEAGLVKGGFETDDVLAAIIPLMKQTQSAHASGFVAPLNGLNDITVMDSRQVGFIPEKTGPARKNLSKVESLQSPVSHAVEVVAESRRTADINEAALTISNLRVGAAGEEITKPVFLPGYRSWEHAVGHHDELTDIFSLGLFLASIACGLNFNDPAELEAFATGRKNLFAINHRLNPVVASVIVQMTELNRHKRAPDLAQMISRLVNYREQQADLDLTHITGFKESGTSGRRKLIQAHLRDRLFEISRRNRLIYFRPSLQTLNLTVSSVPVLLDYRNIKLEQLFVWHPELAATITANTPLSLGKYLRFEDAPYIPGVLDKIISEARRDRAEFGFAQLRLVICFLRWNNLKEAPNERIHSPLLLLPVELTKKRGVRDNYVLEPSTTEAEVNPALRHYLKELYNLELPEFIDLKEFSLDQFYDTIKAQIQASEPGVTLNKIDRPQIELIHEKARQRLDQYNRRMKIQNRRLRSTVKPVYSYDRENFRPLGLQLFLEKVRPARMPLSDVLDAPPQARLPNIVDPLASPDDGKVLETSRQMFALREGDNQNGYSWDFDLCNLTIGNFNYRKMTLVRDYSKLIETDLASGAFDAVFSLSPKPPEATQPPLELADQQLIISCDATQASAISRARSGASYIIQGPPGTGKSQTITNLIADYVAKGKRVLFVCEKRAAIDVVFHRLRQQGLDELCCLIHDSQTDKKAFILNLKQTYEKFLGQPDADVEVSKKRDVVVREIDQELATLRRFSDVMRQPSPYTGIPVRSLLLRLVELQARVGALSAAEEEILPDYPLWTSHGEVVNRLTTALTDLGEELCFAKNPLRWLGKSVLEAARPIETLTASLDKVEDMLDGIESALDLSALPGDLWKTFDDIKTILDFAARARPLAERGMLQVLTGGPTTAPFDRLAEEMAISAQALVDIKEKTKHWREPLAPDDTENALVMAHSFENSFLRFLKPAYWRLKKMLAVRYDFSQHTVCPSMTKILGGLSAQHQARAGFEAVCARAAKQWQIEDAQAYLSLVTELRADSRLKHKSVQALLRQVAQSTDAGALFENLANIHSRFSDLDRTLQSLLTGHDGFDFAALKETLVQLREQTGTLAELSPILNDLAELPPSFGNALRRVDVLLNEFEGAIGCKSLNRVYRDDRALNRFEGRILARKIAHLDKKYREWLALNARCIRAAVRRKFMEHVNISSLPTSQLQPDQKVFKKSYGAGRRDLEHEFGKTMRYKSIRDLAAGDTGQIIRDLKPIWLMSPLSVSDTLPLDPELFDVVIFDEASQIPLEEAIPAIYRTHQIIIVGDEMQLPPTTFFAGSHGEDENVVIEDEGERVELDLDSDSLLTQAAQNLPSTLLAWHYRSRYESLISFSNASFYSGNLFTIPDRQLALQNQSEIRVTAPEQGGANADALLGRSISFHFMENGVYQDRTNPMEAHYIAHLVRALLHKETKLSIGVVAFSLSQQTEIEHALHALAEEDSHFAARLESEVVREENDVFCGLFVKNLENVQGDERDIIIMSVCYGHDHAGRMLMNFGPINQRGGEKRLNVIFSRAKHHMALVSSIRHSEITNDYNDGANNLKNFLQYAEAVSKGDTLTARRVLENLNPLSRKALAPMTNDDAVIEQLAAALRRRGHSVDLHVGQSKFRCDLAVRGESDGLYKLGILVDTDSHYANPNLLERYFMQPSVLKAFGWSFALVLTKDWFHDPVDVLNRMERLLQGQDIEEAEIQPEESEAKPEAVSSSPVPTVISRSQPVPPAAVPRVPSPATASSMRYLEFVGGSSRKFWEISLDGDCFTVRFGRIGTMGQSQTKRFSDKAKAQQEADRLIAEKIAKGYAERRGN